MTPSLLELSHELLHCIFIEVEPYDISNLMLTCKAFNNYIRGNRLLHRVIYHRNWDAPAEDVDWEAQVQNTIKLNKILDSSGAAQKESQLAFVAEHIERLLNTANIDSDKSLNIQMLTDCFNDAGNVDAFLTLSSLFARAGTHPHRISQSKQLQQTSAKLHCLYGLPITELRSKTEATASPAACTRQQTRPYQIHAYARSKVYDLREYTDYTLWGPFMDDGSQNVDWEKVEAILIDLAFTIRKFQEHHESRQRSFPLQWTEAFQGITPNSFISPFIEESEAKKAESVDVSEDEDAVRIRELALKLDARDPYGVSGTWMRIVCFLDYNALYDFNFMHSMESTAARPPLDSVEGMLGVEECWRVVKIEPPGGSHDEEDADADMDWSNFTGTRLPIVHFAGISRSLHSSFDPDANSRIRGTVRQTPEGEIRWTTFSIFNGEERWRSESIQVGGLKSARGVVGNWFDKDYSESGPAGPTAFWKVSDNISEPKIRQPHWPYL